jgi:hypothetical protein
MVSDIISNVTGGVITAVILGVLGIGTTTIIIKTSGGRLGKNIIIIAWIMIIGGFAHAGAHLDNHQDIGEAIGFLGLFLLPIGGVIKWYQH